jgi:predicted transposase YbfD/YdcC
MSERTVASIPTHFAPLRDPRVIGRTAYPLVNIIFIAICAVICGVDTFTGMEVFAESKRAWLSRFLDLSAGIPSHDTFNDVLAHLDPEEFESCLLSWVRALVVVSAGQLVAIDGKTVRGSYDAADGKAAIHMVSVWATKNQLCLGQRVVAAKSNEITAIPQLLDLVELAGGLVTIDAMGCQKQIAAKIRDHGADYVLAVKLNQGRLYRDVAGAFREAMEQDFVGIEHDQYMTEERGHGRVEYRTYYTVPVQDRIRAQAAWADLTLLGVAIRERQVGVETEVASRFYIASRSLSAQAFAEAVRGHWGIENQLHWQLDVTFGEDASRLRKGHSPQNFSILRRTALSLLKHEPTCKNSIAIKRQKAGWDQKYLEHVLTGAAL